MHIICNALRIFLGILVVALVGVDQKLSTLLHFFATQRNKLLVWRSTTSTSLPCGWCASSQWPTSSSCSTSPPTSSSTAPSPPPSKEPFPRWLVRKLSLVLNGWFDLWKHPLVFNEICPTAIWSGSYLWFEKGGGIYENICYSLLKFVTHRNLCKNTQRIFWQIWECDSFAERVVMTAKSQTYPDVPRLHLSWQWKFSVCLLKLPTLPGHVQARHWSNFQHTFLNLLNRVIKSWEKHYNFVTSK